MSKTVARIDRDYISRELGSGSRVGLEWTSNSGSDREGRKVRFRLLDDDANVYYGGWLLDDPEGLNQLDLLLWGEHDAGCTEIQVKINSEWKTEIG